MYSVSWPHIVGVRLFMSVKLMSILTHNYKIKTIFFV